MNRLAIDIEGTKTQIEITGIDSVFGITLCCSVLNEEDNMKDFIEWHKPYVDKVVVVDGGSIDKTFEIASKMADKVIMSKFTGHYGNHKNRAIENAMTGWVLFLDPDERLSKKTLESLNSLTYQEEHDCYSFKRENLIDGEADLSHGDDYQVRLFRSYCRYVRPVHEELVGFKCMKKFPNDCGFFISHKKKSERHKKRNFNYVIFESVFLRELGAPGSQTLDSFTSRYKDVLGVVFSAIKLGGANGKT